jgi:2-C-methyl-D-erythritol 4-phosphate cytidylyltransferase / 2-C-methyl-D-erythritol 2,4-cyclodiphosphate synthase
MFAVILVAAGRGERLGAGAPKAFVEVRGRTLLSYALEQVAKSKPAELVVVAPVDFVSAAEATVAQLDFAGTTVHVVPGGESRQQSVQAGLAKITAGVTLVHDAARAFAPAELFERGVQAIMGGAAAAIPVAAIADTVKRVASGWVTETLDRAELGLAQTPQAFETDLLRAAHLQQSEEFTDDAALLQSLGLRVAVFEGSTRAFKVTTPDDLQRVEAELAIAQGNLAAEPQGPALASGEIGFATRVGVGVDAHRFAVEPNGVLMLGCLEWPGLPALDGHSDGDSVAHALVDAMLSAAGLGDIGSQFGVARSEYAAASGARFITETRALIENAGFELISASVEIVADKPKIADRRAAVEARLTDLCGAPVSLAATTTDGLGFLADSRGVAAVATALIRARG